MLHTYPHLHLHLESCDSTTLAEKVATGVFDLALGFPQELRPALQSELDLQARPAYLVPHSGLVFRYQEKGIHAELLKMASNSQVDAKTLVEQVRTQPIAAASARIHHWAWNQFFQVPQGLNSGGRIYAPTTRASFQFAACGAGLAISSRPAHPHDEIIKRSRQGKVVVFHPVSDPKVKMCFLHPELLGVVNEPRLDPPAEDTHFVIYLRKTTLLQMDQHLLPEVTALLALVRALTNGEESFERTLRDVGQRGLIRRYRFEHGKLWHDFLN